MRFARSTLTVIAGQHWADIGDECISTIIRKESLMKRKWILIVLAILAFSTTMLAAGNSGKLRLLKSKFVNTTHTSAANNTSASLSAISLTQNDSPVVPTHIAYGLLFHEIRTFSKKVDEFKKHGIDMDDLRQHHKNKAELTDRQAELMTRIALATDWEVEKVDEQAKDIINEGRKKYGSGVIRPGGPLPQIPDELKALQQKRDSLILSGREKLKEAFGEREFERFDKTIQRDIANKIKPVTGRPRSRF